MQSFLSLFFILALMISPLWAQEERRVMMMTKMYKSINDERPLLSLYFQNQDGWHTYWKNPGDAGIPHSFTFWINDKETSFTSLEWPLPKRFLKDDLLAFGYEGKYGFFFEWPMEALQSKGILKIKSEWLVCQERCIPETFTLEVPLNNGEIEQKGEFAISPEEEEKIFSTIPSPGKFPTSFEIQLNRLGEDQLELSYTLPLSSSNVQSLVEPFQIQNFLTPFPTPLLTFGIEQIFTNKDKNQLHGKMRINWEGLYATPPQSLPSDGLFSSPLELSFLFLDPTDQKVKKVSTTITKLYTSRTVNSELIPLTKDLFSSSSAERESSTETSTTSLWVYLLWGLIGGFILNFMPCVLPVISLKLFGLLQLSNASPRIILKHNLLYTLGIFSSFTLLALIILTLQWMGESVGWGMHLQSPYFIFFITAVLFVFTLNLFGLFEFHTPGGGKLGGIKFAGGLDDFFNGVLATILSTPCSAPFLGTALAFAFTTSPLKALTIFWSIALGLSLPFLLTAIFPKTLSLLPKPGLWMDHLKKFLGLGVLITVVWCISIFLELTNGSSLLLLELLFILSTLFFAIYFHQKMGRQPLFIILFYLVPLLFSLHLLNGIAESGSTTSESKEQNQWERWSTEALTKYQQEKRWVFMDFTAEWCLTCKANEKLVIETSAFHQLAQKYNMVLLKGDWTKRDPLITDWLKSFSVVGVPAYFLQTPEGKIIKLGEIISMNKIQEAIDSHSIR